MVPVFNLQGHRGARGLKPENTLTSFEIAFDLGVTTIETDLHLTKDGFPIIFHDPVLTDRLCRSIPGSAAVDLALRPPISSLLLAQVRGYRADRNSDPRRFPDQDPQVTPLARGFAREQGIDPFTPPTLADLFAFAQAYAGEPGRLAGKSPSQRDRVQIVGFDLELKRVPFRHLNIGDAFDGKTPALFEEKVLDCVRQAGMLGRTAVRSFDHRCVRPFRRLEPALTAAVLVAGTAPVAPGEIVRRADTQIYCPEFEFLDEVQVRELHADGIRVLPWTVNEADDWQRLLDWKVDGITTDYPDRLATFLTERGVTF